MLHFNASCHWKYGTPVLARLGIQSVPLAGIVLSMRDISRIMFENWILLRQCTAVIPLFDEPRLRNAPSGSPDVMLI
jgi:hypothetical protein